MLLGKYPNGWNIVGLFSDPRIFVSALQYHWHVQGVVGADDEAKHHIDALVQRLHQFGHRTKEREMELWHRLSSAMDLPIGKEPGIVGNRL